MTRRRRSSHSVSAFAGVPLMVLGLLAASFAVPRSEAAFSDSVENNDNSIAAATNFTSILYLHNNPSPPTGPTASQTNLSLSRTGPTATTLYNYDTDFDGDIGRLVKNGNQELGETNDQKFQQWVYPITTAYPVSSTSSLSIWVAPKDFASNKTVGLVIGLYDCNASLTTCSLLASSRTNNPAFPAAWTEVEVSFASVTHTFAPGSTFMLKFVTDASTDVDVWIAYDTTTYPSSFSFTP